ncbi:MAG: hypothetical protein ABJF10_07925 [Chthoniobacter sp.]|uniref:hypothetical protein n=1 Tax=Chthoniobacter sp. TaxID=2510640 RepID=UPI0032AA8123
MKSVRLILAAFLVLLGLTGCLQVEKVVKLQTDGSGTIEETVVLTQSALTGLQQMTAGLGGDKGGGGKMPDLFDEAKLKAAAARMGDGVTFVSAKKIEGEQGQGFTAIYAFSDINKVKLDQNPGDALPDPGKVKASSSKKEPITFHFTKGSPAELTLAMPAPEFKPKKPQAEGMEDMAMQMMKQMFKDMRISLAIEVQGTISETNAEYRDGSRVTLMDMDFNKVLADPEKFKALAKANPQTLQEAKTLIKGLDGVKIETAPEVKIKFQ